MGYFIRNTNENSFLIDNEDLIGHTINSTGKWESTIEDVIKSLVNAEDFVINVGANIGYHTIKMANITNKVIAFEPQQKIYNQLCANIYINDCNEKITAYKLGLGDTRTFARMESLVDNPFLKSGNYMNYGGISIKENATGEQIEIVTLDEFGFKPDFILMDAEGFEDKILQGSINTLQYFKPTMLLEIWDNKKSKIFYTLKHLGYEIFWSKDIGENYVVIHPEFKNYESQKNSLKDFRSY